MNCAWRSSPRRRGSAVWRGVGMGGGGGEGEAAGGAASDDVERMFAHLEEALVALDFLDPANPKKLMPRLRRLFARATLEREEVAILRGIAKHILLQNRR